jgi:recombination protein RecR
LKLKAFQHLQDMFRKLPGIGPRSAERLAYHVLLESREFASSLAQAVLDVKDKITHCRTCFNFAECSPCEICGDPSRDHGEVWVVEQPKDLLALEATGLIRGTYHVLLGHLSALDGVEPEHLTIAALCERVCGGSVREVILALNPTLEGDGTALYLQSLLADQGVKVTRPARGLAVGSQLEYATIDMLAAAIRGRAAF